jgi:hypothetical protein
VVSKTKHPYDALWTHLYVFLVTWEVLAAISSCEPFIRTRLPVSGVASLPQRVVLAQVAGLRELCEHTSDLVRLLHLHFEF